MKIKDETPEQAKIRKIAQFKRRIEMKNQMIEKLQRQIGLDEEKLNILEGI